MLSTHTGYNVKIWEKIDKRKKHNVIELDFDIYLFNIMKGAVFITV